MMTLNKLILLVFVLVFNDACGCSCKRITVEENIDNAKWIFTAKVNRLAIHNKKSPMGYDMIEIGYEVIDTLKGDVKTLSQLTTGTGTCGMDFKMLNDYLIMADQSGSTNICIGSIKIIRNKDFAFFSEFDQYIQSIRSYIESESITISPFYNPLTKRTLNSAENANVPKHSTGCKKTSVNNVK